MCSCGYNGALSAVVDGPDQMRKAVRDQLRQADGMKQACRYAGRECLAPIRHQRQPGPKSVLCRGMRVVGKRIQEKVSQPMTG